MVERSRAACRCVFFLFTVFGFFTHTTHALAANPPLFSTSPADLLAVEPTAGLLNVSSVVEVNGSGSGVVGEIRIYQGVGTVVYRKIKTPAVAYVVQPYDSYRIAYQILLVQPSTSTLARISVYCNNATKSIFGVYHEDTNGTIWSYEVGSGTCGDSHIPATINVTLPAISLPPPALVPGAFIQGTRISYNGIAPGWVRANHITWQMFPYSYLDCSWCAPPGHGWYEYFSLLWDSAGKQLGFGIIYFLEERPDIVLLDYCIGVPSLGKALPLNNAFYASWNRTQARAPVKPLPEYRRSHPLARAIEF